MQALRIEAHGPVDNLRCVEADKPQPGLGEVLVQVQAAAINPSDVLSAQGKFPHSLLPRILGRDFAGRVVEGPDELLGKEVWGSGGDLGITRNGTHAEYLAIPGDAVALRPANLTAVQAAAVGVPFLTAWCAIERGGLSAGEYVIVSGAAGAVGSAAAQLANARGANVIALLRNRSEEARLDLSKFAGVAHSDSNDLAAVVSDVTGGKNVQLALNAVGSPLFEPMFDALARGGRMVIFSAVGGQEVTLNLFNFYRADLTLFGLNTAFLDVSRGAEILNSLRPLFESGTLAPPHITQEFPLSQASEAYAAVTGGKVVLVPDASS